MDWYTRRLSYEDSTGIFFVDESEHQDQVDWKHEVSFTLGRYVMRNPYEDSMTEFLQVEHHAYEE